MTDKPLVALTGANGYVGGLIAQALRDTARILPLVRSPRDSTQIRWTFASDATAIAEIFRQHGVTHLVHAAWDMEESKLAVLDRTCVGGSQNLLDAAQRSGIRNLIFISTISAFDGARSAYGRSKFIVEREFRARGGVVLRLGLVYSETDGGLLGNLRALVRKGRIIPLIGDGTAPQYLLHERTLNEVICRAAHGDFQEAGAPITLAHPDPIPFRALVQSIANQSGQRVRFLPLPWRMFYMGLLTAESLELKLNFRSDSIISFVFQNSSPDFSGLRRHAIEPIRFKL